MIIKYLEYTLIYILLIYLIRANAQQSQSFSNVCQSGIREDNTNYIYCARRGLTEVPLFSKNNVVYDELVLSDNKISQLNIHSFSRIKVKKVYLNGNPIRLIEPQAFSKLENNLEELWLDADMTSLNEFELEQANMLGLPKAIQNLRNLNTLKLKGFLVKQLDSSILKRLNRIEILSLQFCSIEQIDKSAFEGLKNSLKELYLDGNLLQSIPTESLVNAGFKNLKVLSLSQNNIKTINIDSFGFSIFTNYFEFSINKPAGLSSISKLDLSYNGLKQVDSQAFNGFNNTLEVLYLQNNEINSYNLKFIRQLQILKELNLDFNLISNLASSLFVNSAKLQYLSLQGNSIQFDEVEFSLNQDNSIFEGLTGLHRLNLARNGIKHLPNGLFKPVKNLKSLILDKNLIDNLNELTFDGLFTSLMNISLQNTKLKSNNLISLKYFQKLERIKLGFNDLDQIDWSLFALNMHSTLSNLDLQNNRINQILFDQVNSSSIMQNLLELDLSNNKLCEFDSNLLDKMPKLKNLGLSQNPLYCDCNLLALYEWSRRKFDKDMLAYVQWQCEMPETQKQTFKRFTSLSASDFVCKNGTRSKCRPNKQELVVARTTSTQSHYLLAEANPVFSRISNIQLKSSLNSILVSWELDSNADDENIRGFKLTFSKAANNSDLSSFLVDRSLRNFKLDNLAFESKYTICVSIVRAQGYDKYCRDIQTESDAPKATKKQIKYTNQSALLTQDYYLGSSSNIISGLMISILIILVIFIFCLIVFLVIYIRKCRVNQKNLKKSLYIGSSTLASNRRGMYQGAIMTSTAEHKPIDAGLNETNKCCCSLGQNTIANQRFIGLIHPGCNSLGRALTVGDTSTVSSTLSSVNNNNTNTNIQNQTNNLIGDILAISPTNNLCNEWRFKPTTTTTNQNTIAIMPQVDLGSSTPTSFTHFIVQSNNQQQQQQQQQSNEQTYMPYELFNCYQQQLLANSKKAKHIVQQSTFTNSNDHVYCEIPSTIGRSGQVLLNSHCISNNSSNANRQNSSASLLLSSSTASSSTSSSNSSSPQSNFTNNTKYTNASII